MIFAVKPFEIHDGDGIRTTVFFKGCPLRCQWCHNPESFSFDREMLYDAALCRNCLRCTTVCEANTAVNGQHIFHREKCTLCGKCLNTCFQHAFEIAGTEISPEALAQEVLKDEIFMKSSGGGVTFSGGEPLMQPDLAAELARCLKQRNVHIAIDTSGFVTKQAIDKILPYADMFLFDIKAIDEDVHIACTGVSNKQILENIRYVDSCGIPMEIRYPYVPGKNDSQVEKIAAFLRTLRCVRAVRILPYHDLAAAKYRRLAMPYPAADVPLPTQKQIAAAAQIMQAMGIPYTAF